MLSEKSLLIKTCEKVKIMIGILCILQVRARLLVHRSAVLSVGQEVQVSAAVLCGVEERQPGPRRSNRADV